MGKTRKWLAPAGLATGVAANPNTFDRQPYYDKCFQVKNFMGDASKPLFNSGTADPPKNWAAACQNLASYNDHSFCLFKTHDDSLWADAQLGGPDDFGCCSHQTFLHICADKAAFEAEDAKYFALGQTLERMDYDAACLKDVNLPNDAAVSYYDAYQNSTLSGHVLKRCTRMDSGYGTDGKDRSTVDCEFVSHDVCCHGGQGSAVVPMPWFGQSEQDWDPWLRRVLYIVGLLWMFVGVGMISDMFMNAIEEITSKEKIYFRIVDGQRKRFRSMIWNPTVANLTLMALGSSAPEILLAVIELFSNDMKSGSLGASTIVGSAAFNLFIISAVCIWAVGPGRISKVARWKVFAVTACFSVAAYIWLVIVLMVITPNVVDIWEAFVTFLCFPVFVSIAYMADIEAFCFHRPAGEACLTAKEIRTLDVQAWADSGPTNSQEEVLIDGFGFSVTKQEIWNEKQAIIKDLGMVEGKDHEIPLQDEVLLKFIVERLKIKQRKEVPTKFKIRAKNAKRHQHHAEKFHPSDFKFDVQSQVVLENIGTTEVKVNYTGKGPGCVYYKTVDGSAVSETTAKGRISTAGTPMQPDYVSATGTLEFDGPGSKSIAVKIFDDDNHEANEEFFVYLHNNDDHSKKYDRHVVNIIDDDAPGILCMANDNMIVGTEENLAKGCENLSRLASVDFAEVKEIDGVPTVLVPVIRKDGTTADVSCKWRVFNPPDTQTTEIEKDLSGDCKFHATDKLKEGSFQKVYIEIPLSLMTPDPNNPNQNFVHLECFGAEGGVAFDSSTDGDATRCILYLYWTVPNKLEPPKRKALFDRAHTVKEDWWEQICSTWDCSPDDDDDEEGGDDDDEEKKAGPMDYFMWFLCLPFSFIFNLFVVPAVALGGWACFITSLIWIGIVTMVIGDLASLVGCVLGMPAEITAITFVALGTSLPDTFASMQAAEQDSNADASLGNITGSNSVNVFLGLGLPWVCGSIYWVGGMYSSDDIATWKNQYSEVDSGFGGERIPTYYPDGVFVVDAGNLGASVITFSILACICFGVLTWRRHVVGGELGGSGNFFHMATAIFTGLLWLTYIVISIVLTLPWGAGEVPTQIGLKSIPVAN